MGGTQRNVVCQITPILMMLVVAPVGLGGLTGQQVDLANSSTSAIADSLALWIGSVDQTTPLETAEAIPSVVRRRWLAHLGELVPQAPRESRLRDLLREALESTIAAEPCVPTESRVESPGPFGPTCYLGLLRGAGLSPASLSDLRRLVSSVRDEADSAILAASHASRDATGAKSLGVAELAHLVDELRAVSFDLFGLDRPPPEVDQRILPGSRSCQRRCHGGIQLAWAGQCV